MKKMIYLLLGIFLILGIYIMTNHIVKKKEFEKAIKEKKDMDRQQLQQELIVTTIDTSKMNVQKRFNEALKKIDALKSMNKRFMQTKEMKILDIKDRISNILSKKDCSYADIAEAQVFINQLNLMLNEFDEEIKNIKK